MSILKSRIENCIFHIHKTKYLLDPRFRGEGLRDDEVLDCMEVIANSARHLGLETKTEDIVDNARAFMNKDGVFF